jgi:hypothetical protein
MHACLATLGADNMNMCMDLTQCCAEGALSKGSRVPHVHGYVCLQLSSTPSALLTGLLSAVQQPTCAAPLILPAPRPNPSHTTAPPAAKRQSTKVWPNSLLKTTQQRSTCSTWLWSCQAMVLTALRAPPGSTAAPQMLRRMLPCTTWPAATRSCSSGRRRWRAWRRCWRMVRGG